MGELSDRFDPLPTGLLFTSTFADALMFVGRDT